LAGVQVTLGPGGNDEDHVSFEKVELSQDIELGLNQTKFN